MRSGSKFVIRQLILDVIGITGYMSSCYGVWMLNHAAAFITAGVAAVAFAISASKQA